MANTGYILPQSAESVSESPYNNADGAWATPQNIYGTGSASITSNSWDSGELSHVLKAYNFNLSAISAGSTINGIVCRVVCSCTASATMNITLAQLLSTTRVKGGTNMASTPIAITPQGGATITIGASNNNWGNSLTLAWLQDADFGVAIGVTSGTNNADVNIDSIEIDVYYTENLTASVSPSTGALTLTGYAPTVFATDTKNVTPSTGELVLTGYSPTVSVSDNKSVTPATGEITLEGHAPIIAVTENKTVEPATGELTLEGYAPNVSVTNNIEVLPQTGEITLTGYAPTIEIVEVPTFLSTVKSLVFSADGSPWARIAVSSTIGVNSLQFSLDGSPWWGVQPSALSWTTKSLKYYTGGTWIAKPLKYYTGSTWVEKPVKVYVE